MKKIAITILSLLLIFTFILVICAFNSREFLYCIYPFARITGEYEITINGKEIAIFDEYYEYENNGKIRLNTDTESFKIKAGEYGPYKIGFIISDKQLYELTKDERFLGYGDVDLSVICYQTNWWNVSELDIEIDIFLENGEWFVYYNVESNSPLEKNDNPGEKVTKKVLLKEVPETSVYVGI